MRFSLINLDDEDRSDEVFVVVPDGPIEVSFSSLRKDLDRKARIYARAGVREYWVVDLKARVVHVHLDPSRGSYAVRHEVAPPALLSPTYLSLPPLPLADLLSVD